MMLISTTSLLSVILLLTPLSSSSRWLVDSFILPSYKVVQSPLPQCHQTAAQHKTQHTTTTACANSNNDNNNTWRSAIRTPTAPTNTVGVIRDLCNSTPCRKPNRSEGESGLAFLFVSQQYADSFEEIVAVAYDSLVAEATTAGSTEAEEEAKDFTLLSIVGGGVIGDGLESDDPNAPAISLLTGILPKSAQVEVFMFGNDDDDDNEQQLPPPPPPSSTKWNEIGHQQDLPSYIVFADPFSKIQETLNGLDSSGNSRQEGSAVVAGGISCPILSSGNDTPPLPTVAVNNKAYPRGTIVGIGLSGSVGLHVAVAQGCRPVGMTYEVTKADGNFIEELDGRPALDVLGEFSEGLDEQDKQTIQTYGIMVGLATPGGKDVNVGDYLIRQILGFRAPAVMVGAEVNVKDLLKFHVRDPAAALHDMQNMIGRYRTERMFATNGGIPLAALQISCVARGRSLFGSPNVDVGCVKGLFSQDVDNDDDENKVPPAIGGFYANGEIGPTGIAGVGITPKATHMHGFTTVACTIVDFSRDSLSSSSATGAVDASVTSQVDNDAWG